MLERYGAEAPPKVMWAVHDDIRELYRQALTAVRGGDAAEVTKSLRGEASAQTDAKPPD